MTAQPEESDLDPANRSVHIIALTLMLVALWGLTHHYKGFSRDGELYAVQALQRIHPSLGADVYLENTSQDQYTIFSPMYAALIGALGLRNAELLLFVICTAWFLAAAWILARKLADEGTSWLAVALLVITGGYYGAYSIFSYSENYLTARSLAEALVVTALACHFLGRRRLSLVVAAGALCIHPLMAFPGLLLLLCVRLPPRVAVAGAVGGVLAVLGLALIAVASPAIARFLTVIDSSWLEVVRERSQFLFLRYWTRNDWQSTARPFLSLGVTAMVVADVRIRKLCFASVLVGAAGLAVALIACEIGPVAILLQGQAWRWIWISDFVGVLLLAPTALYAWREKKFGPVCAALLISGWTVAVGGTAAIGLALLLWPLRSRIDDRAARYLRWGAGASILILVGWNLANFWSLVTSPPLNAGREALVIERTRSIFGLQIPAVLAVGLIWYGLRTSRTLRVTALVAVVLAASSVLILPGALRQVDTVGTDAEIDEFADWRDAIPPTSNVLMVPTAKSASFAWFTLERPSYMSVDQSAGVVFSRATALEIRRRSQVLLPIMKPDWQILSQITQEAHGKKLQDMTRPLTLQRLLDICQDPLLGFVIAKENVGFESIRHTHAGGFNNWNLYDCRRVRSAAGST
jgi:hypothetical protein